MSREKALFSFRRSFVRVYGLGVSLGFSRTDRTFCLIVQLGRHTLVVGPHLPPAKRV